MPVINITVKNKIARADNAHYVCGNSDFVANFKFDSEWDEYETKTARFSYNGSYVDVVFDGDQCPIPIISDTYFFVVGVYAGNLHTTTPARVPCKKSILCDGGSPADPPESVYNQLMEQLNDLNELSDEELAAAVDAYFAEHPVAEPPDWNQNDPEAKDYIKNRPFYETETGIKAIDEKYLPDSIANLPEGKMDKKNPTGTGSFSMGRKSGSTVGDGSHAEGSNTTASGAYSHAEGSGTAALYNSGHAEGVGTTANGTAAHAEGYQTTAFNRDAHAEGESSNVIPSDISPTTSTSAVIEAWETTKFSLAKGNGTHSEGKNTLALSAATAAHAEGYETIANGDYGSHAEGSNTVANGRASHAEGYYTTARGYYSHAEGSNTVAESGKAHAEGNNTKAAGEASHAEGSNTVAESNYSHAEGMGTVARGYSSHAEGSNTVAESNYSHAEGRYNLVDSAKKYAHIVGNGSASNARSNAHTLDWDGVAWFQGRPQFGGNAQDDDSQSVLGTEDVVNNLTSDDTDKPLSAAQGKELKAFIDDIDIPDKLPSPKTLQFSGGSMASYDGSTDVTVPIPTVPPSLPNPNALTVKGGATEQSYNGSAAKSIIFPYAMPQFYGATGNGTTDDTTAVQSALANNRYVYIPAGTYKLSGTLTVRAGCRLELAPDAVLNFTQTSGNCIALGISSCLCGNHATVVVPYAFTGNAVYVSSAAVTSLTDVPPFTRWTPQWKPARYLTDLNITKPDSRGFHYSVDGTCSGKAVYIEADGSATSTFIWGLNFSGLRIAGAFSYGIHAKAVSNGWNHDMHLEAVIDGCEIGICLEDCNNNYITATIQPRAALTTDNESVAYAKHGIQLIRSRNTDLSATRVWDWNAANTLWTSGGQYQHIAMVGNCSGTILSDFLYYETSYDIRSLIYTDTPSNLEKMTILQEPFTRWFKPSSDGLTPYFYNGTTNKELLQKEAFDALFQTSMLANFTNKLSTAANADGSVFNTVGYQSGKRLADNDGTTVVDLTGNTITGFIPCAANDVIRLKGISFATSTAGAAKVYLYDSNHTKLVHVNQSLVVTNGSYYNIDSYAATTDGCSFRIVNTNAAYLRLSVDTSTLSTDPVVTVNEQITYTQAGFLADSVKVKASSVVGLSGGSEGAWTKIIDAEVTAETAGFTVDELDNYTEFYAKWSGLKNKSDATASGLVLKINDTEIAAAAVPTAATNGTALYGWTKAMYNGLVWEVQKSPGAIANTNTTLSSPTSPYNLVDGVGAASKISLVVGNAALYAVTSGKLEVWGR